jgi:hypothetical protein
MQDRARSIGQEFDNLVPLLSTQTSSHEPIKVVDT